MVSDFDFLTIPLSLVDENKSAQSTESCKDRPRMMKYLKLSGTNTLPQRRKGVLDAWLNIYEKDQYLIYSLACYQEGMLHLLLWLPGA